MSFTRVTQSGPCPVCRKTDWCRVFADGWVECMRIQSDRPAKSGGWMHSHGEGTALPWKPAQVICTPPLMDAPHLMRVWLQATSAEVVRNFAMELGVSVASLKAVGAAWSVPHQAWAFPMRDGLETIVGIRLRNERGKFAVRGSRQGIFTTTMKPQPTMYVCEGPTDTAAAVDLGLFAVGRPNCCCGGADIREFCRRHAVRRVVMLSDNDKPGLDGARKVGLEIGLLFAVYVPPAKDLRAYLRLGGTSELIANTLRHTVWSQP